MWLLMCDFRRKCSHLRSSLTYVDHTRNEMPFWAPERALKRLCAVGQSATPQTEGAMRTNASSPTSFLFKFRTIKINFNFDLKIKRVLSFKHIIRWRKKEPEMELYRLCCFCKDAPMRAWLQISVFEKLPPINQNPWLIDYNNENQDKKNSIKYF